MREDVRCVKAKRVTLYQRLQHRGFNGDVRPPTKHSPCVPTAGCTSSCYTLECYLEPVAADL